MLLHCTFPHMTHHTPQHQKQLPPTCLHLDTAACVLLLALRFIGGFVAGGTWAGQVGVRSQIPSRYERAHVDVVGEDVVTDELTEEQDQVGELHSFTFIPRLRYRGNTFNNVEIYLPKCLSYQQICLHLNMRWRYQFVLPRFCYLRRDKIDFYTLLEDTTGWSTSATEE